MSFDIDPREEADACDEHRLCKQTIAELEAENAALRKDAERLDWIERQSFDDLRFDIPIDRPHDGEYEIRWWDGKDRTAYGKTFRAAIDAAMCEEKKE